MLYQLCASLYNQRQSSRLLSFKAVGNHREVVRSRGQVLCMAAIHQAHHLLPRFWIPDVYPGFKLRGPGRLEDGFAHPIISETSVPICGE